MPAAQPPAATYLHGGKIYREELREKALQLILPDLQILIIGRASLRAQGPKIGQNHQIISVSSIFDGCLQMPFLGEFN